MRTVAIACLAVVAAASGCDRLVDGRYVPVPLAVMHGALVDATPGGFRGAVSLAIAWYSRYDDYGFLMGDPLPNPHRTEKCVGEPMQAEACDGTPARGRKVCRWSDDLPQPLVRAIRVEAGLGEFTVPILELPPLSARYDLRRQGGQGTFALGYLIAFVDEDGDGRFKYGTPEDPPEPVVAVSPFQEHQPPPGEPRTSWFVMYLDGTINLEGTPDPVGNPDRYSTPEGSYEELLRDAPQGLSLWRKDEWIDAHGRRTWVRRQVVPIETPMDLFLLPKARRSWGCREGRSEFRRLDAIPPGFAPLFCPSREPDLDRAVWNPEPVATETEACVTVHEEYRGDFSCASVPPPSWDCPLDGSLEVRIFELPPNPDGYRLAIRSTSGETLTSVAVGRWHVDYLADHLHFWRFPAGRYVVELEGLASGCGLHFDVGQGFPEKTEWMAYDTQPAPFEVFHRGSTEISLFPVGPCR